LQIQINGITERIREADCPPLLLQPLIENALRHDLDCHQGTSNIQVDFSHDEQTLTVKINNAIHANSSPNPGAGLGLRNTRARLQMAYGQQATLITQQDSDRYIVTLQLPLMRPERATVSSTE
jgi:two-component system sensor histidine kinase AlgZ